MRYIRSKNLPRNISDILQLFLFFNGSSILFFKMLNNWSSKEQRQKFRALQKLQEKQIISLCVESSYCLIKTVSHVTGQIQQRSELYNTTSAVKFLTQLPCCSRERTALSSVKMPAMGVPKVLARSSFHWSTGNTESRLYLDPRVQLRTTHWADLTTLCRHFFSSARLHTHSCPILCIMMSVLLVNLFISLPARKLTP